jgi:Tfp pilus assembly protein FimV
MNQRLVFIALARARWLAALGPVCVAALWLACVPSVQAAGAPESAPVRTYVTVAGDTPDRVIQKTMADSPLKVEVLRQALAQANPQVIAAGRNQRLKTGTVLHLPDHAAVVRHVLLPLLPQAEAASLSSDPAQDRRRWVRFP